MAVILTKSRESTLDNLARKASLLVKKPLVIGLIMLYGGSVAYFLASPAPAKNQQTAASPSAFVHKLPGEDQFADISYKSTRIAAAVAAYSREEGALPEELKAIIPLHYSGTPDSLGGWALDSTTLILKSIPESVCDRIGRQAGDVALDSGSAGLSCVEVEGGLAAVYRIAPEVLPSPVFAALTVTGSNVGKLVRWKAQWAPDEASVCNKERLLNEQVVLKQGASWEHTLCLRAFPGELEPAVKGLSLLEGSGSFLVEGRSLNRKWSLAVNAAACDSGESSQAVVRATIGKESATPLAVRCDLRR